MNTNMKFAGAVFAAAVSFLNLRAAPNGAVNADGDYEINVAAGNPDVTMNDEDVAALGTGASSLDLVKTGKGRLIISTDLNTKGWDGLITVKAGYLRATVDGALGGVTKGTVVEGDGTDGGSFEFHDNGPDLNWFTGEPLTISGVGVDGAGAVYCSQNGKCTTKFFHSSVVTLAGDTTVGQRVSAGGGAGLGLRNAGNGAPGYLDMQGHTLTYQGSSQSGFYVFKVVNPGHIVLTDSVTLVLEGGTPGTILNGDASNTLTMGAGTTLTLSKQPAEYYGDVCTAWTLITRGDVTLNSVTSKHWYAGPGWNGPVQLGGIASIGASIPWTFKGALTGTGGLFAKNGTVDVASSVCSYSGATRVANGAALRFAGLIPGMADGLLQVDAGGTIEQNLAGLTSYDGAVVVAGLKAATTAQGWNRNTMHIWTDLGATPFATAISGPMIFGMNPSAVSTIGATLSGSPDFDFKGGETVFTGSGEAGLFDLFGGTVTMAAGSSIATTAGDVYAGAAYPDVARFRVENGATFGSLNASGAAEAIAMGRTSQTCSGYCRGIFEMEEGATVVGRLDATVASSSGKGKSSNAFCNTKSTGSYFVHGGSLDMETANDTYLGDWSYGFFAFEGGVIHKRGNLKLSRGAGSYAQWRQSGGNLWTSGGFTLGNDKGVAEAYVAGGMLALTDTTITVAGSLETSSLTLGGTGVVENYVRKNYMSWCLPCIVANADNATAILNFGGASRFRVGFINRDSGKTNNRVYVGFDGGTFDGLFYFLNDSQTPRVLFRNFDENLTHVTIYEGGATIGANFDDVALGAALEAPTGNGIVRIDLPQEIADLPAWEYVAPPRVVITDATGVGAHALADFDTRTGKVTGFTVDARGFGYSASPTVTISGGGTDKTFSTVAVVAPNKTTGGLTKIGPRTITVDKTCSYGGETVVREGTLKLGTDNALDASSGLRLEGGTFDADGKSAMFKLLGGQGAVVNLKESSIEAGTSLSFKTTELIAKKTLTVDAKIVLPAGATVSVDDFAGLAASGRHTFTLMTSETGFEGPLPAVGGALAEAGWYVRLGNGGKSLKLGDGTGCAIIVR